MTYNVHLGQIENPADNTKAVRSVDHFAGFKKHY